jgi:phosphatidylethanolamine/phosphatidyl-N-methylethanolamine N-methyltransferase
MQELNTKTSPLNERLAFFRGFLKRPNEVASVIPSSRFMERRLTKIARLHQAHVVVELGPGTGGTTRAMLHAMSPRAKLLCIELQPEFVSNLHRMGESRLSVFHGSAELIQNALDEHQLPQPDVVISGIPFSTMPQAVGQRVVQAVHQALVPGGHFIAYQMRKRVAELATPVFGKPETEIELLNVPPMFVFSWCKLS